MPAEDASRAGGGRGDAAGLSAPRVRGADPAPVARAVAAISSRSTALDSSSAVPIQPSTCSGARAPTIAPLTPGQASVQATATEATVVPRGSAMGRRASRSDRLRVNSGSVNAAAVRRQSSSAMASTRVELNVSVRMPFFIGL